MSFSTLAQLSFDHELRGLRGEKRWAHQPSGAFPEKALPSIQP
jgi:hypothetical protein